MVPSPITEVFARAMRLALRAGTAEIGVELLLLALDFETGPGHPVDLRDMEALFGRLRGDGGLPDEDPVPAPPEPSGGGGFGYSSRWVG